MMLIIFQAEIEKILEHPNEGDGGGAAAGRPGNKIGANGKGAKEMATPGENTYGHADKNGHSKHEGMFGL